jgi:hypothetical protein
VDKAGKDTDVSLPPQLPLASDPRFKVEALRELQVGQDVAAKQCGRLAEAFHCGLVLQLLEGPDIDPKRRGTRQPNPPAFHRQRGREYFRDVVKDTTQVAPATVLAKPLPEQFC